MTIQEAIQQMANAGIEAYCKVCTVDAVDEKTRTIDCTPIDDSAPLLSVNLQANQESEDGIVSFPAIGSYVVVAFINSAVAVVVLSEKIDKVMLIIGDTSTQIIDGQINIAISGINIKVTSESVIFNDGSFGGLVISKNTADKLNTIEKDLNDLKEVFSLWMPVSQDGGGALKGAITPWAGKQLTPTAATELENDKVKH